MGANPSARTAPAVIAEQQAQCYKLQLEGLSIREIAPDAPACQSAPCTSASVASAKRFHRRRWSR